MLRSFTVAAFGTVFLLHPVSFKSSGDALYFPRRGASPSNHWQTHNSNEVYASGATIRPILSQSHTAGKAYFPSKPPASTIVRNLAS